MAPRMVYVAYPIDQLAAVGEEIVGWYTELEVAKESLLAGGVDITFDPGDAFKIRYGSAAGPELRAVNQFALQESDGVIAMLPAAVPSVGVPMEIDSAAASGKAVAIITDVSAWMLQFGEYANVQQFPLDREGFGQAVNWLIAQERATPEKVYDPLPFVVLDKDSAVDLTPRRTYEDDAGWDLVTSQRTVVAPGAVVDVPCGIAIQLPDWAYGRITGRSSTLRSRNLLVNEGIIDTGWRGPLFVNVKNMANDMDMGSGEVVIEAGERIGQLILHTNDSAAVRPVQVQDLVASDRGTNGFGSTGQ